MISSVAAPGLDLSNLRKLLATKEHVYQNSWFRRDPNYSGWGGRQVGRDLVPWEIGDRISAASPVVTVVFIHRRQCMLGLRSFVKHRHVRAAWPGLRVSPLASATCINLFWAPACHSTPDGLCGKRKNTRESTEFPSGEVGTVDGRKCSWNIDDDVTRCAQVSGGWLVKREDPTVHESTGCATGIHLVICFIAPGVANSVHRAFSTCKCVTPSHTDRHTSHGGGIELPHPLLVSPVSYLWRGGGRVKTGSEMSGTGVLEG